jgi:hypothetical protein
VSSHSEICSLILIANKYSSFYQFSGWLNDFGGIGCVADETLLRIDAQEGVKKGEHGDEELDGPLDKKTRIGLHTIPVGGDESGCCDSQHDQADYHGD